MYYHRHEIQHLDISLLVRKVNHLTTRGNTNFSSWLVNLRVNSSALKLCSRWIRRKLSMEIMKAYFFLLNFWLIPGVKLRHSVPSASKSISLKTKLWSKVHTHCQVSEKTLVLAAAFVSRRDRIRWIMGSGRSDIRSPSCLFCSSILSLLEPGPKNLKAVLYYIHISSQKKKILIIEMRMDMKATSCTISIIARDFQELNESISNSDLQSSQNDKLAHMVN